ncbi:MAG: sugar phosphate isomerase/epimerase [Fidelibacterota bacterium]|nr:MAG: sugar phosphate isomerase/epimerase [Candidatus Neomarinimicrobiota bacterium]
MRPSKSSRSTEMTRGEFLTMMAATGIILPTTRLAGMTEKSRPGKGGNLPLCIFSKHLQFLDYDAMAETAAEIGFDGVDLTVRPGGHVLPENVERDLPRAVKAVRQAGLEVNMMTSRITDPDDPQTVSILKTAGRLGIGYYRMGYLKYKEELGVVQTLESYKPQLRELAGLNEKYGIHGAYQNHSGTRIGGPVWDVWLLIKDLDPRWVGCQYDIRHAVVEGGISWPLGLKLLGSHIKITAIKDFYWAKVDGVWKVQNCPLGEGMVDFKTYFKMVNELRIEGPVSIHFEYPMPAESEGKLSLEQRRQKTVTVMKRDLETLRSMLKEAGLVTG